ncbi:PEP-CTERM sorting domain-containing protein [bacterium]|nr:PEP-CTERM sorting domain-containing protein [bacterium]
MKKAFGIVVAMAALAVLAPAAFGAVTLHLDAASIGQADATPVNAWGSLTQADPNKQPLYTVTGIGGLPSVTFDGVGSLANGDALLGSALNVAARTIYAVVNPTAGGGLRGLVANNNDQLNVRLRDNTTYTGPSNFQDGNDFTGAGGTGMLRIDGLAQTPVGTGSFVLGSPHIVTATSAGAQNYANFLVGNSRLTTGPWETRYWQGDIAEIIVHDTVLNKTQHEAQLSALGTKYGIAVSLLPGTILGTGASALLGGDLTDPENDGLPDADVNYNAIFTSTNRPFFGAPEGSFNVFDNRTGGGDDKWCCDDVDADGHQLTAEFVSPWLLTHFTVTSSNDSPQRDPRTWEIQGSNDGVNFTTIFSYSDPTTSLWTARQQVMLFQAGVDFVLPADYFRYFRYSVTATGGGHALGELEYFGIMTPEPGTLTLLGLGGLGLLRRRRRARA